MNALRFCLNDRWVELDDLSPTTTLLRYLRDVRGLTGTKEGCAEGDCGACTVAVLEPDRKGGHAYRAINACLLLLPMLQGKRIYTVEALKDGEVLHPVQEALVQKLGSQCGYCTPGVVMSLFEACYRKDLDAPWKVDAQLCGNLCRCTGYRPIRDAAVEVAGLSPKDRFVAIADDEQPGSMALSYQSKQQRYETPTSFAALWDLLDALPGSRFIHGGTDLSLEVTKRYAKPPLLISLEGLPELRALELSASGFRVGAGVNVAELEDFAGAHLPPLARMTRYFGARQIKHRATVGGNLCTASPIGDLAPVFIALQAQAVLRSRQGERRVALEDFFVSYRQTALKAGELLVAVEFPKPSAHAKVSAYKLSKRRELDISTVSAAFAVELDAQKKVVSARLAFGGMAALPSRARAAEAALVQGPWDEASVEKACALLAQDFQPLSDHRGSSTYRSLAAANLLRGFLLETAQDPQPSLPFPHAATLQAV